MGMRSGFPKMNPAYPAKPKQNNNNNNNNKKTLNKKLQKRKGDEIEQTA